MYRPLPKWSTHIFFCNDDLRLKYGFLLPFSPYGYIFHVFRWAFCPVFRSLEQIFKIERLMVYRTFCIFSSPMHALAYVADVDRRNLTRINVVTIGLIHMCHGLHWFFWLRWNCKALPVWYAPGYFRLMFLYMLLRVFLVSWNTSCRVRERDCPFSFVLSSIDFLFIWPALPLWFIQAISKKKKRKKFLAWLRDVDKSHLF